MVRKDPANNRGPAPNRGRTAEVVKPKDVKTLFELRPEREYERLWNHVLVGTETCINMINNYVDMGMPGIQLEKLKSFRDRLDSFIKTYETKK